MHCFGIIPHWSLEYIYMKDFKSQINWKEFLFFAGFIFYLGRGVWGTTMFPFPNILSKLCFALTILFIGLKILLYDSYPFWILILAGIMGLDSILTIYYSHYLNIIFWVLLILGAKDISFKKIVHVYLLVEISIVGLAILSALFGVIVNLKYITNTGNIRQSFGIVYTTDFASHIFYIILTLFYLMGTKLKWYHYITVIAISWIIYKCCQTRLDCISMLLIVLLFGIGNCITQNSNVPVNVTLLWNALWKWISPWIIPLFATISFIITLSYKKESSFWDMLNKIVSQRLSLGLQAIQDYGFTLWGQTIDMHGAGSSTIGSKDYFFIDCSYILVCLRYGLVAFLLLMIVYSIICIKNRNDLYFLYAITLLAVNCVIAHHILELEYHPFALALLSQSIRPKSDALSSVKRRFSTKQLPDS